MAEFTVNLQRFDPYQNFKFRVKWDGRYVAGVSRVSALKRSIEIVEHREGGDTSSSRKSPGRTEFEAITLERAITHDNDFEQWANAVPIPGPGQNTELSLKNHRKDVTIEVYNSNSDLVITYKLLRCWVSEYQAFTELDGNSVVVEKLKLENEGWERSQVHTNPVESV
ncbi:MAG TPA: phage tail protein [Pyrinomonadaceae bacterium]|nr:phage tail protein [Pyrinomonadaceae bacterium]